MANKRSLKKYITDAASELMSQAFLLKMIASEAELPNVDKTIGQLLMWQDSYIRRVSHPDGKDNPQLVRKYYKSLVNSAAKELQEIDSELERILRTIE